MLFSRGLCVLIALPHLDDVVDTVDADEGFHLRADVSMGIAGVTSFEDRAFASERCQAGQVRAGGGAEQRDPIGIDLERACVAAHELHASKHVLHRLREHLVPLLRQPVADGEQGIAALGEVRAPVLEGAAHARLPAAAMDANQRRETGRAPRGDKDRPRARRRHDWRKQYRGGSLFAASLTCVLTCSMMSPACRCAHAGYRHGLPSPDERSDIRGTVRRGRSDRGRRSGPCRPPRRSRVST